MVVSAPTWVGGPQTDFAEQAVRELLAGVRRLARSQTSAAASGEKMRRQASHRLLMVLESSSANEASKKHPRRVSPVLFAVVPFLRARLRSSLEWFPFW